MADWTRVRADVLDSAPDRANGLEWKFVVRHLYIALDMPEVPGFPASRVQQILWGELPPDPVFFQAIVLALTAKTRSPREPHTGIVVQFDPSGANAANWHFSPAASTTRYVGTSQSDQPAHPEPSAAEAEMEPVSSPAEAIEAFARTLVNAAGGAPRLAPPDPDGCASAEQFIDGLKLLRRWSGCSFRQLEERSKQSTDWLPRATMADMLRRSRLPKADTLWAFTSACGLPKDAQARWEAVRSRLKEQAPEHRGVDREVAALVSDAGLESAGVHW